MADLVIVGGRRRRAAPARAGAGSVRRPYPERRSRPLSWRWPHGRRDARLEGHQARPQGARPRRRRDRHGVARARRRRRRHLPRHRACATGCPWSARSARSLAAQIDRIGEDAVHTTLAAAEVASCRSAQQPPASGGTVPAWAGSSAGQSVSLTPRRPRVRSLPRPLPTDCAARHIWHILVEPQSPTLATPRAGGRLREGSAGQIRRRSTRRERQPPQPDQPSGTPGLEQPEPAHRRAARPGHAGELPVPREDQPLRPRAHPGARRARARHRRPRVFRGLRQDRRRAGVEVHARQALPGEGQANAAEPSASRRWPAAAIRPRWRATRAASR